MKKTISVCLEEDTLEKLDSYIAKNRVSSRSVAIERLLNNSLNHLNEKNLVDIVTKIIQDMNLLDKIDKQEIVVEQEEKEDKFGEQLDSIISQATNEMLD